MTLRIDENDPHRFISIRPEPIYRVKYDSQTFRSGLIILSEIEGGDKDSSNSTKY